MSTLHFLFLEKNSLWLLLQSGCTMQMPHCAAPAVIVCVYGSRKNIGSSQSTVSQDRSMLDCMQCLLCLCMCVCVCMSVGDLPLFWAGPLADNRSVERTLPERHLFCVWQDPAVKDETILHQRPPQIRFCLFLFFLLAHIFLEQAF